jgi:hypothetical protein
MLFWPVHSLFVWMEHIWKFFCIWPVTNQGRARFCSFGAVGECAKHAYAPSPTANNAFFLLELSIQIRRECLGQKTISPYHPFKV